MTRFFVFAGHIAAVAVLTALTQLGGIAWIVAALSRRRFVAFAVAYIILSFGALFAAPFFGREALSCAKDGPLQMKAGVFCALNRHYVSPELKDVLYDLADAMDAAHPGTITQVLDAGFPFWDGMPLLPHLSHDDGEKADIAFYYARGGDYLPGQTRTPLGYFAFEDGPTACPWRRMTLRWDMAWLQKLWPELQPDVPRMTTALQVLKRDARVGKVFLEPHLAARFSATGGKLRFQGCRAARHDDHIHIQL